MYSGPRHTDVGEAMAHNRRVEQAREAEHQRRCDQSPAYKRVYQRWQQTMAFMGRQQAQVASAIQEAVSTQRVSDTMGNIESQPLRHGSRPDPLPPPSATRCPLSSSPPCLSARSSGSKSRRMSRQWPRCVR